MKSIIIYLLISITVVLIGLDSTDILALLATKVLALLSGYITYRLIKLWNIQPTDD